jgi:CBS domain-containing membrane protein
MLALKEVKMRKSDFLTGSKSFEEMTADHLMENNVVYFDRHATCDRLLLSMVDGHFGSLPIVDEEERLIGIVTQHGLINAILSGEALHSLEAGKIMSPTRFVSVDCLAFKIGRILQETGFSHIPVVDHESRLVGIITGVDLLHGYMEGLLGPLPRF